ncbi:IclR family transcriptional regulator [Sulfitobacter sp.]|uniref:IclR family transcriptional regulator n=1 Tax=Sulfitobacter sp. TaxID=1903071 RepID=UPI0030031D17
MSSAAKTLGLLAYFSPTRPEIGLSQLCKLAGRDKATTYRHLQALEDTGFVEQNPATKQYRLGPAVLQLAQTREITVPRKAGAEHALSELAEATGETSHVSVLSGSTVYALASCESPQHSTRAIIDIQTFPLHATASGLCALAFGSADLMAYACKNIQIFTATTVQTPDALRTAVETVRQTGFAWSGGALEIEVQGLAAPVFDHTGLLAGSISVASVATRFTPELQETIQRNLIIASREITRNWGGTIPDSLEAKWASSLSNTNPQIMEFSK